MVDVSLVVEQLMSVIEQLEGTQGYQEKRARISDINALVRQYGKELATTRERQHVEAEDWDRDAWLDSQIQGLVAERKGLREQIDVATREIERLRGRLVDERKKVKGKKTQGVRHVRKTVLDMSGQSLVSVLQACPMVETRGSSLKYLSEQTDWQDSPRLYFGMGGGSQSLTKGFPLDAVGMILAGEVLRRVMGLQECSILCADVITRTNPFPTEQIQTD